MKRWFPLFAFALVLLAACATSKPAVAVDPVTDPTVIGAVDESVREGSIAAAEGAQAGRRIGRVAGVVAAVLGGPRHDTLDDAIDRYRLTRDLAETTGAIIAGSRGATAGAKRGLELDLQFAELHKIGRSSGAGPSFFVFKRGRSTIGSAIFHSEEFLGRVSLPGADSSVIAFSPRDPRSRAARLRINPAPRERTIQSPPA